jgi:hypothetical protein
MQGKEERQIEIPEWMDRAVTELAAKENRTVDGEIARLVETALKREEKGGSSKES